MRAADRAERGSSGEAASAAASPTAAASKSAPGVTRPPSACPACTRRSDRSRRPSTVERHVTTTSASSGPSTRSSFLPTTTRYWTRARRRSADAARRTRAGEQVVLDRRPSAGSARRASGRGSSPPTGRSSASSSSVEAEPERLGRGRPGWRGPAARRCGPTGSRATSMRGRDAVVLVGPVEPRLVERRRAVAGDQRLVDGEHARLRPDRVVQLRRLERLAELGIPGRDRRHARRPAPRCRAPAGGRGAGSRAGRRRR